MKRLLLLPLVAALTCTTAEAIETITDPDEAAVYERCQALEKAVYMGYTKGVDDQKVNVDLLSCAEEAAEKYPNRIWPLGLKRNAYTPENRKWLEVLQEIKTRNPKAPDIHASIGLWYLNHEMYSEAIPNFKTAIKLDPKGCQSGNLGRAYTELGSYDQAIQTFGRHFKTCPGDYISREVAGRAYFKRKGKGDLQTAKKMFLQGCEGGYEFSCQQLKHISESGKLYVE